MGKRQVTVCLPDEDLAFVQDFARAEDRSVSAVIRSAVRAWIRRCEGEAEKE